VSVENAIDFSSFYSIRKGETLRLKAQAPRSSFGLYHRFWTSNKHVCKNLRKGRSIGMIELLWLNSKLHLEESGEREKERESFLKTSPKERQPYIVTFLARAKTQKHKNKTAKQKPNSKKKETERKMPGRPTPTQTAQQTIKIAGRRQQKNQDNKDKTKNKFHFEVKEAKPSFSWRPLR
jgi:hypothetical protein